MCCISKASGLIFLHLIFTALPVIFDFTIFGLLIFHTLPVSSTKFTSPDLSLQLALQEDLPASIVMQVDLQTWPVIWTMPSVLSLSLSCAQISREEQSTINAIATARFIVSFLLFGQASRRHSGRLAG